MKKSFCTLLITLLSTFTLFSQAVTGKITCQQGQNIDIKLEVKSTITQQAMGSAIDFVVDGSAMHVYKVTNATDDNNTLHHDIKRITFNFDGMGSKRSFDSDNKKDMDGMFGPTVKDILSKSYDMIIDPNGKVLMVKPEKIELAKNDDRLAIVFNVLRDITNIVYPPKRNDASLFRILPDTAVKVNDSWMEKGEDINGKFNTTYTLTAITDSTLLVDFKGNSVTNTKAEMMGMQITSNMNNAYTGNIILNKITGLIKEKTINTTSNGTAEAMGNSTPVTSKTTIIITVNPK